MVFLLGEGLRELGFVSSDFERVVKNILLFGVVQLHLLSSSLKRKMVLLRGMDGSLLERGLKGVGFSCLQIIAIISCSLSGSTPSPVFLLKEEDGAIERYEKVPLSEEGLRELED